MAGGFFLLKPSSLYEMLKPWYARPGNQLLDATRLRNLFRDSLPRLLAFLEHTIDILLEMDLLWCRQATRTFWNRRTTNT